MDIGDISGVVLAGGKNSRFDGRFKAKTIIGNDSIINSILRTIRPVFKEVIIVTNNVDEFSDITGCLITGDRYLHKGPLGGIHAAMRAASGEALFVFAGDMPFLSRDLILTMVRDFADQPADALVPVMRGNPEPLHSVYMKNLAGMIEEIFASGTDYMMRNFLKKLAVRYYEVPDNEKYTRSFTNINTRGEADRLNFDKK
jgi:molybdenum cofactor guanylyltransferase